MGKALLLDTHALIWWTFDPKQLSQTVLETIEDSANAVFVSAVSAMEIATKVRKGHLDFARPLARDFKAQIEQEGFGALPITLDHAEAAGGLAIPHPDPWDRLLIAQARIEDLRLVSNETLFDGFAVDRLW